MMLTSTDADRHDWAAGLCAQPSAPRFTVEVVTTVTGISRARSLSDASASFVTENIRIVSVIAALPSLPI